MKVRKRRFDRATATLVGLAFGFAGFAGARVSSAQTSEEAASAELFREGRKALEEKDYAAACPKFAESLRYDRRVGTLLSLAECEEARGKLAVARTRFQEAEDLAREQGDPRASFASGRFHAVDVRVPRLLVRLSADAPADAAIERDGGAIRAATLDLALPVEIGPHTIVVSAPGHSPRTFDVALFEGEHRELTVEPGERLEAPVDAVQQQQDGVARDSPAVADPLRFEWRPLRLAALGAGALGLVGIGLGSYFGIKAIDEQSGAPGKCLGDVCNTQGSAVRWDAIRAGNVSTAAFVVGGALGATGIILWVISPSKKRATRVGFAPAVGGGRAALNAFGTF